MDYIKEKVYVCGDYMEADIIPSSGVRPKSRIKKKSLSLPKQKNLNEKNSRRYFIQLVNTNFSHKDYHVTITYDEKHKPITIEEAERNVTNYIRRLKRRQKKVSNEPLKYVLVTQFGEKRTHHHLIISSAISRDDIENAWGMGRANCDRLKPDEYGLEALSRYLVKHTGGKKRWSCSHNLKKPLLIEKTYSHRGIYSQKNMQINYTDRSFWEKCFKGYIFTECKAEYNDITGWSYYAKMRRQQ